MRIKRFSQIFESVDPFIIDMDTIKELCLEMTEEGYVLDIDKQYLNYGSPNTVTKRPSGEDSSPLYDIELEIPQDNLKGDGEHWNGGVYFDNDSMISNFHAIVTRFKRLYPDYKILYAIRNSEYTIRIILPRIKTERDFNWLELEESVKSYINQLKQYGVDGCNIDTSSYWINGNSRISIGLKQEISRLESYRIMQNSDQAELSNEGLWRTVEDEMRDEFSEYVKNGWVTMVFSNDLQGDFTYEPLKKGIFGKKPPVKKYHVYYLNIDIVNKKD